MDAQLAEFEQAMARSRKRKTIGIMVTLLLAGAGGVWALQTWDSAKNPAPGVCRVTELKKWLEVSEAGPESLRYACDFTEELNDILEGLASVPPDMQMLVVAKGLAEEPKLLVDVCGGEAVRGFQEVVQSSPDDAMAQFLTFCPKLKDEGLKATLHGRPIHRGLLALAVYGQLAPQDEALARRVASRISR